MQGEAERAFLEFRRAGRPRALARVFDLTAQELLLVAGNLARRGEEAEELVQQTFLVAMEQRARWDEARPLLPWLLGILLRLRRAERRRRAGSRERDVELEALQDAAGADPARRAQEAELAAALAEALAALPTTSRDVLALRLVHGLEPLEIAHALGRPLETVKTQLKRGKERLREALPRSLAALVALEGEGLAAVRADVLRAATGGIASPPLAWLVGGIGMKTGITLSVALALAGLWWWSHDPAQNAVPAPTLAPSGASAAAVVSRSDPEEPAEASLREARAPGSGGASQELHGPGRAELACRVVREADGAPAPGVTVALWHSGLGRVALSPLGESDAEGRVRFVELAPGPAWVGAVSGGELRLTLVEGLNEAELRLPTGLLVEGVVLDEDEEPVPGAELWVSEPGNHSGDGFWALRARADGRFLLRDLEAGRALAARAPGHAPGEGVVPRGLPGERVSLALHVGGLGPRLHGIVRDESGEPVAGAYVLAGWPTDSRYTLEEGHWRTTPPPRNAGTDAEGRFELDAVAKPGGDFRLPLSVHADGFVAAREELRVTEPETWVEVTLVRGAEISGTVRDEAGAPRGEVEVSAAPPGAGARPEGAPSWAENRDWTGPNGAFRLGLTRPGTVELVAALQGVGEVRETVELVAGQPFLWEPVLLSAPEIRGVVRDGREAVPGLRVSARAQDEDGASLGPVLTDAAGLFRLPGAARERYTLQISDPSSELSSARIVEDVRPGEPLELHFPASERASARLVAHLLDTDGAPYASEWTILTRLEDSSEGGTTDCVDGRLETGLVPPGTYLVTLCDARSERWTIGPFALAAGETRDVGEHRRPASGRLEVELRDALGAPPVGGWLHLHSEASPLAGSLALDVLDGRVVAESLQPGAYVLLSSGFDQPMARLPLEVRAGETTRASFALPAGLTRWLQFPRMVVGPSDLLVEWRRDGEVLSRGPWGIGDGRRPLRLVLAPGHYELELALRDGRRATTGFDVDASTTGEDQAVQVRRP